MNKVSLALFFVKPDSFKVMITETGSGLHVLIFTEPGKDWETFATWYSFFKNLPDAARSIFCLKNDKMPFQFYQWAKRLNMPVVFMNGEFHEGDSVPDHESLNMLLAAGDCEKRNNIKINNILIVKPLTMAIDLLNDQILDRLNSSTNIKDDYIWYMKDQVYIELFENYFSKNLKPEIAEKPLCIEAKESEEIACFTGYRKGCGKWIDTAVGCPFSSAGGLATTEMTANECRIIELWERMVSLYSAVV